MGCLSFDFCCLSQCYWGFSVATARLLYWRLIPNRPSTCSAGWQPRRMVRAACCTLLATAMASQLWHFRAQGWALTHYAREQEEFADGPVRCLLGRIGPGD